MSEQNQGGEHRRPEPQTGPVLTGEIVATPTTDQQGDRTATPQAKIVAVLSSAAGVTVVGALITAFTGVTLDPVVLTAIMGGATGLVGTLAGYLTSNRSSAN